MRPGWALTTMVALLLPPGEVEAHDFRPGALTLVERAPGQFQIAFTPPVDSTGGPATIEMTFPEPCRRDRDLLDCGEAGLTGRIALDGMTGGMRVVVMVVPRSGDRIERIATAASPNAEVEAAGRSATLWWLRMGAEHILYGADHVAFVLGLLLLLGARLDRRLLATLTAFTAAHSLTLGMAVLGVVRLPAAPVEATIAASVVLVAREATHELPTATRRAPWAVALLFGLVHGLGFAGALEKLGVPDQAIGWSLLWFNVGVELGQIGIVFVASLLAHVGRRWIGGTRAKLGACYVLGGLGAWWLIDRTAPMVTAWL